MYITQKPQTFAKCSSILNIVQHLSSELIRNAYLINMSNPPEPAKEI